MNLPGIYALAFVQSSHDCAELPGLRLLVNVSVGLCVSEDVAGSDKYVSHQCQFELLL